MSGTAPTLGQHKELNLHWLKGMPAIPADLAGTEWELHLRQANVSHEAFRRLMELTPAEALRRLNSAPPSPFPEFANIMLGTHLSAQTLSTAIVSFGRAKINDWAYEIMQKTPLAGKQIEIALYCATTAELGFPEGAEFAEIRAKIRELGFADCPAEVGPQLRRQYKSQPENERLNIVMEPILDKEDTPGIFALSHDTRGLWLACEYGRPSTSCAAHRIWVFTR